MTLTGESCVACRPGSPKVTDEEIRQFSSQIPEWDQIEVDGVKRLRRSFKFDGWMPAVDFANSVARVADQEDHHPTILIAWGRVTVTWWTHAIKGLHRNDFIMAAKTDEAFAAENRS
jgi:4a-hydroxytetrahydrobiopterin dehydratase